MLVVIENAYKSFELLKKFVHTDDIVLLNIFIDKNTSDRRLTLLIKNHFYKYIYNLIKAITCDKGSWSFK